MNNKLQLLKPRNFGDIINDLFIFIRLNFGVIWRPMLLVVLPFAIVGGFFSSRSYAFINSWALSAMHGTEPGSINAVGAMALNMIIGFTALILAGIFTQLIVINIFLLYEAGTDELPSTQQVLTGLKQSFLRFLGFNITLTFLGLLVVGLIAGFCFLIVEAGGGFFAAIFAIAAFFGVFYLFIPISITPIIYMREQNGIINAVSRSFYLIKGHWWQTFALTFLTGILISLSSMLLATPFYVFYGTSSFHSIKSGILPDTGTNIWYTLAEAFKLVSSSILSSVLYIVVFIQYYSLVERKDGESTMRQIENMGSENIPAV